MIAVICVFLTSLSMLTISGVWQECKNTPENTIKYSFKLEKPGLCFTEDCRAQDLTNEIYTLYSALFQTQIEKDELERTEIRNRLIVFGREAFRPHVERIPDLDIEYAKREREPEVSIDSLSADIQTDLDICCPTRHTHTLYTELANADNIVRTIVHFGHLEPPVYQFVPEGTCVDGGGSNCKGQCFQEFRDHYLLVHDPSATTYPPVKFDKFRIKSYCSCKGL